MSVPNDIAIIRSVFDPKKHDPTTKMGCGLAVEDFARALKTHDPRYGLLKKPNSLGGANKWNGHGVDVVCFKQGGRATAIDVFRAGESSEAELGWNPDQEGRYLESDWMDVSQAAPFVLPQHSCRLGASLFWYFGAFHRAKHGEPQFMEKIDRNADWIVNDLHGEYVRDYSTTGGSVVPGPNQDPWALIGSFYRWPDWAETIAEGIDYLFDKFGLLHAITFVGEAAQFSGESEILRMVDDMAEIIRPRAHKVWFGEMWNERVVTGGNDDIVRKMGERFYSRLPSMPFALDTPTYAMGGLAEGGLEPLQLEMANMHRGSHASVTTPQWNRSEPNPLDLGPTAARMLHISHEPRGPGASAGGDVHNPLPLMHDYIQAIIADKIHMAGSVPYAGYTLHSKAGVWGGYCNTAWPGENQLTDWYSLPTAKGIAYYMSSVRAGKMPDADPDPEPPVPIPGYDVKWILDVVRKAIVDEYAKPRPNHPNGFPLDDGYADWIARTEHDYCGGMGQNDSLNKHVAECSAELDRRDAEGA